MNSVRALIIDDEEHNRSVLNTLLLKYCPDVKVIDQAIDADDAYEKISNLKPQLIFLDIKMPQKSGFDLLRMFDTIDFEVIFVSAFNDYAISAFDFNALGYILKPIDFTKLKVAVDRAVFKINQNKKNTDVTNFINTIDNNDLINKITVHVGSKVIFIPINDVVLIESFDSSLNIYTIDNKKFISTKDVKEYESLFHYTNNFFRTSKSSLVNLNYLKSYSKGDICILELETGKSVEVSRRKKGELLEFIKRKNVNKTA